jgi:hypothetical protein
MLRKVFAPHLARTLRLLLHGRSSRNFKELQCLRELELSQRKLAETKVQDAQIVEVHLGVHLPALGVHEVLSCVWLFLLIATLVGPCLVSGLLITDVKRLHCAELIPLQML